MPFVPWLDLAVKNDRLRAIGDTGRGGWKGWMGVGVMERQKGYVQWGTPRDVPLRADIEHVDGSKRCRDVLDALVAEVEGPREHAHLVCVDASRPAARVHLEQLLELLLAVEGADLVAQDKIENEREWVGREGEQCHKSVY